MLHKAGLLCAALAMFSIAGGHWAVLQSVAWAGMLADYTQRSGSVATAVVQTFDGEHPCALCKEISVAKAKERQPERAPVSSPSSLKAELKAKALLPESWVCRPNCHAVDRAWFPGAPGGLVTRAECPPVPPPRAA